MPSLFIMLAHNISSRHWWYGYKGWIFPPLFHYILLLVTFGSKGAVWHGSMKQRCVTNFPHVKKLRPLPFISVFWMFVETCQWMWGQWDRGWCISTVMTVMWKISHILDGHAHTVKNILSSLSVEIYRLWSGSCVRTWISAPNCWKHGGNIRILRSLFQLGPTNTQKQKVYHVSVFQGLLNHYKVEGHSFLDCIVNSDKMWCQHYQLVKTAVSSVAMYGFPTQ